MSLSDIDNDQTDFILTSSYELWFLPL
jgi:hypothetical protein